MDKPALPDIDWPNFGYFFRDVTLRYAERTARRYRALGRGVREDLVPQDQALPL